MIAPKGYRIDWHQQFAILEPFTQGKPGVIHVNVARDSPTSLFIRVMQHHLSARALDRPWICVQIDPDNSETHYFEDVVRQISRVTQSPLDLRPLPGATIVVGEGLEAGGNIDIRDVRIDGRRVFSDDQLVEALAGSLERRLATNRIALVFHNSHRYSRRQLNVFANKLWEGCLSRLAGKGILVMDVANPRKRRENCQWPPDSDATFDLPTHYGQVEREAAVADLSEIAIDSGAFSDRAEAAIFARTLVSTSMDIRDLHARVSFGLAGL